MDLDKTQDGTKKNVDRIDKLQKDLKSKSEELAVAKHD